MPGRSLAPTEPSTVPVWYRGDAYRQAKGFLDATHRACAPEETSERISPLLPWAGITRLADVTGLDRVGVPTILAMRPNAPTLANSSGKGFTLSAAKVSAAMEGIELHCAEEDHRFTSERLRATHRDLVQAGLAIEAELLPLSRFSLFHEDVAEDWVLGWDLIGQREIAVPFEIVSMASGLERRSTHFSFQVGSNGLASGNVFLEAVCSGLAEVIERDAVTTAVLRARHGPGNLEEVDLRTVVFDRVRELLARLERAGISPVLFDCTADTGVPAFMSYLLDREVPATGTFRGYGAHLDPEVAMVRALTESIQSRAVYIAGSRDDLMVLEHRRLRRSRAGIRAGEGTPQRVGEKDASAMTSQATQTFEGDCQAMLRALQDVGLSSAVVVDLTLPELGIPVVKVVVPGLEGYSSFSYFKPGPRGRAAITGALAGPKARPSPPIDHARGRAPS
ncbi:MAG TPA: YcaO-like family protein [Acidimicrobiales bacterium]|nr:YcaO-like family protein [Acidimicrobiales bacterium]